MMVVGGIYSLHHYSSCWLLLSVNGHTGKSGAHRTLHCSLSSTCHVSQPLGLEQSTVDLACPCGTSNSPVVHRTVRCDLTSLTVSDLLTL
jgi:hypothetical protein